jgi:hypothetical protein
MLTRYEKKNAIVNQQGSKIKMFSPPYDILPKHLTKPECHKMTIEIPESNVPLKKKKRASLSSRLISFDTNDGDDSIPLQATGFTSARGYKLTFQEKEEFAAKYYVEPEERQKLHLNRFVYRHAQPLPTLFLKRSQRGQKYSQLISSLEQLISGEEHSLEVCVLYFIIHLAGIHDTES